LAINQLLEERTISTQEKLAAPGKLSSTEKRGYWYHRTMLIGLAQGILDLLNEDRRAAMGRAAAVRVREDFTAERVTRELEVVYGDVIGRNSRT